MSLHAQAPQTLAKRDWVAVCAPQQSPELSLVRVKRRNLAVAAFPPF